MICPKPIRDIFENISFIKIDADYLKTVPEAKKAGAAKALFQDSNASAQDLVLAVIRVGLAALGALVFYQVGIDLISLSLVAIVSGPSAAILGGGALVVSGIQAVVAALALRSLPALGMGLARLAGGWLLLEKYDIRPFGLGDFDFRRWARHAGPPVVEFFRNHL